MAPATLIYDGDCPFCSRYVRYVRLKKTLGDLQLVDARDDNRWLERTLALGYDLDEGMVLVMGETYYHGDACLNRLALMSSRSDLFNRANFYLFRSPVISKLSYPILRASRNLVLKLLGRSKIGH